MFDEHIKQCIVHPDSVSHLAKSTIVLIVFMLQQTSLLSYSIHLTCRLATLSPVSLRVENRGIPEEKGLGGSAALCTCLAATCMAYRNVLQGVRDPLSLVGELCGDE